MFLPSIHDFTAEAADPAHYAALDGDWSRPVADVVAGTRVAGWGRHRHVTFGARRGGRARAGGGGRG
ncbi:DUF3095 family protein, partial [Azospirillum brasilense]|nr:DUF3095 family protein [Azospirillum brasilense]